MELDEVFRRAQALGFIGPGSLRRQREHADAFVALAIEACGSEPGDPFLDLGSGGGLPGLVLASAIPGVRGTLLDAHGRRTEFLAGAVHDLGWDDRVQVVNGRAEEIARDPDHRSRYRLVVARSFGPAAVTAECGVGFLELGGHLVVSEPPEASEVRWPTEGLATLGLGEATIRSKAGATGAAMVLRTEVDERWPRRTGIPSKRPLW